MNDTQKQGYSEYVEENLPGIVDGFLAQILDELVGYYPNELQNYLEQHGWTAIRPRIKKVELQEKATILNGIVTLTPAGREYMRSCLVTYEPGEGDP